MAKDQYIKTSIKEDLPIVVRMKDDTPDMTGWTIEFNLIAKDLNSTVLVSRTTPSGVTVNNAVTPKLVSVLITKAELVMAGITRGQFVHFEFLRTDVGAADRLAQGTIEFEKW